MYYLLLMKKLFIQKSEMVNNYLVLTIFLVTGLFLITKEVKENYTGTLTELSGIKHHYTVTIFDYKKMLVNETIYGMNGLISTNVCLFTLNHIDDNRYILLTKELLSNKPKRERCIGFFSNLSMLSFYSDDDGLFVENNNVYLFLKRKKENRLK
ncbi:hypothetical protein GNP68_16235 [Aliivibrio fischeri]|nr:hypothetical protein [Aliivibrio fischeri]